MGSCQSTVAVATKTSQPTLNKSPHEQNHHPGSSNETRRCSSVNSATTTTSCHHGSVGRNSPIPEHELDALDDHHRFIPPVLVIAKSPAPAVASGHRRSHSDAITDYLKAEGASSSRIMVHIENPYGMPIEAVYDGVHDGEVLGDGITGQVRLITHKKTGIKRAVKRLDLAFVQDDLLDSLLGEIKIMCALDHPNIVCLEEVYEGNSQLYLTQELCKGGDLFDRLDEQPDYHYSEAECARLVKQISSAVAYLHSKGVVHRDLKLENFLFQDERNDSELKMIDFGLSKHFQKGDTHTETVGTPYTVAPEVILGKGYDEKCDVWSIGVICYLLLCGETPFGGACVGDDLRHVRQNIISGHIPFDPYLWGNVSVEAIDFIKSLLVLDPERRPSAAQAQNHPWIQKLWKKKSHDSRQETLNPKVVTGLVKFKSLSTTKRFLCEILSFTLQPEQIRSLLKEFEKMDVDGTGEISLSKFKNALLMKSDDYPFSENEIEEIFSGLKVRNTDTSIQWHEFIAACLSQCQIDDSNIRIAFERLDKERKGFVTWKDLQRSMDMYGGSNSKNDLQHIWVNHIIDYSIDKEHMTLDDFYSLLKLEKPGFRRLPCDGFEDFNLDNPEEKKSDSFRPLRRVERRHSSTDLTELSKGSKKSPVVTSVKACRDIRDFISDASKREEEEKQSKKRRARRTTVTGNRGLLMRRDSKEMYTTILKSASD